MFSWPPIPPWEGIHPSVVHFPIALACVVPLFVLLAMVWRSQARGMLTAATLLNVLAAAGAVLATTTGEAGEDAAEAIPAARDVLSQHEELGEAARNLALVLASGLALGTVGYWLWGHHLRHRVLVGAGIVYLVVHGLLCLGLANTAHWGGRLVHELGVQAPLTSR